MSEFFTHNLKVLHATYHRCGSTWFHGLINQICRNCGRTMEKIRYEPLSKHVEGDILFSDTGQIDFDCDNYVGSHMIRDPRDMMVSAYFYHKWSHEGWEKVWYKWQDGKSYQELLNSLDKSDGIHMEMRGYSRRVMKEMLGWNYNNPKMLEIKYEDFVTKPDECFPNLLSFWGIHPSRMEKCLDIALRSCVFGRPGSRPLGEIREGEHIRCGKPGYWREHLDSTHISYIKAKYGKFLIDRGYEKDYNW